ncbi:MAG: glycosyltransferase family 2 protein [Verrucomicrobia bacterium]|nr:glycosyltransferase family 2 protein [Verrucomicrobiota bacterium]
MQLSVVIPAHNPDFGRLCRTLAGLRGQTLQEAEWEAVLVDNASEPALDARDFLDVAPANFRIVREENTGLTPARLRGFKETTTPIIVLADDDNVLAPDYLSQVLAIAAEYPRLGTWSGNVILSFEPGAIPPPAAWRACLTERHVKSDTISVDRNHHDSTPWGAGLCVRREVAESYAVELAANPLRRQLDLQGRTLLYGGDTDIAYVGCAQGLSKGVFARLRLTHLIPSGRCETPYLLRSIEGHAYSSVLHEFVLTGRIPLYCTDRLWLLRRALHRWFLPRVDRLSASANARGIARAVHDIRRLQTSP